MADALELAIRDLARRYPHVFVAEWWRAHRPLALGTHQALCEACPDLRGTVWLALHRYTKRLQYQRALVEGAARVDLAGKPAGTVSAQHAAVAAARWRASWLLERRELCRSARRATGSERPRGLTRNPRQGRLGCST